MHTAAPGARTVAATVATVRKTRPDTHTRRVAITRGASQSSIGQMEPGLQAGKKLKGTNPQRRQTERGSKCSIFVFLAFEASTVTTQALTTERADRGIMTQLSNKSSGIQNFARRRSDKVYAASPAACRLAADDLNTSFDRGLMRHERHASVGVVDQDNADHFAVASADHDGAVPAGVDGDGVVDHPRSVFRRQS